MVALLLCTVAFSNAAVASTDDTYPLQRTACFTIHGDAVVVFWGIGQNLGLQIQYEIEIDGVHHTANWAFPVDRYHYNHQGAFPTNLEMCVHLYGDAYLFDQPYAYGICVTPADEYCIGF